MGFSYDKIFRLILLPAVLLTLPLSAETGSGVEAELLDFVMPHYRKSKLQFVLYGEKGINLGATISFINPLIDIVTDDLPNIILVESMKGVRIPDPNVVTIRNVDHTRLYPLNSSEKVITDFWARIPHSKAVIAAEKALYDKNQKILSGNGTVHFRSRELDIDGEGFDADQKKKFIHIRSKVRVVIHPFAKVLEEKAKQELQSRWTNYKNKNER